MHGPVQRSSGRQANILSISARFSVGAKVLLTALCDGEGPGGWPFRFSGVSWEPMATPGYEVHFQDS